MGRLPIIFSIFDDATLLPHFLKYYKNNGATTAICLLFQYVDNHKCEEIIRHYFPDAICQATKYDVKDDYLGSYDSDAQDQLRRQHVNLDDWYIIADLDEFHEIPGMSLIDAVKTADEHGASCINSYFCDRVTEDGHIPSEISDDIWSQFPIIANVTAKVIGGYNIKTVAAKGGVSITQGHHDAIGKSWVTKGRTHHFKWFGNVIERMKARHAHYIKHEIKWIGETTRQLDLLSKGRVAIERVKPWRCDPPIIR